MKVMWMGNIILPAIAEKESLPPVYIVGWLGGVSRRATAAQSADAAAGCGADVCV